MAIESKANKGKDIFDEVVAMVFNGIYLIFACVFLGLSELRKKVAAEVFAVSVLVAAGMFVAHRYFGFGEMLYVFVSAGLPVVVLLVLGTMRQQKVSYYQKLFETAGFKGKDGLTPRFISEKKNGEKSVIYFKSNIPLSGWKKNAEAIQTSMDCKILSLEQGNSKKVVKLEHVPSDYDIGDMIPWQPEYASKKKSVIALGKSIYGQIEFDFNTTPHWIFAGSTGSGKSVAMRSVVFQCIKKGFRVIIIDLKRGVEFGKYKQIGVEVIIEKKQAAEILQWLVNENKRRLDVLTANNLNNIDEYNEMFPEEPMQRIVVPIDETAILLIPTKDKEDKDITISATAGLENLAILARAAGINLVFGIQRPDANTVTGQIKSNVTGRVCGYFSDAAPSLIVLNNTKANELPSKTKGRFMFQDGEETIEFQCYYVDEKAEIRRILDERQPGVATAPEPPRSAPVREAPPLPERPTRQKKKLELITDYDDC